MDLTKKQCELLARVLHPLTHFDFYAYFKGKHFAAASRVFGNVRAATKLGIGTKLSELETQTLVALLSRATDVLCDLTEEVREQAKPVKNISVDAAALRLYMNNTCLSVDEMTAGHDHDAMRAARRKLNRAIDANP